ncbi:WD40-repeat-containing domain protein [Phascolomyces articulosus]|uniref:WD40-repeat-containing domain protein n=1 Tax=Phascolomyces articulosus TaxID=60185 RepID=A0AAD5PJR6_9FUNG|nr:WD40-repeat-containing domain protein [Phascolomyces articulosus]
MEYQKLVIKKNPRVLYKETPEAKYWKRFKSPILIKEYGSVTSINFSPVSPHDFAVSSSARVQIYSSKTHQAKKTISRFKDIAYSGSFRQDGKLVVAGDGTGLVQMFDVNSRAILRTFRAHTMPVHVARFSIDKTHVLSASDDQTVRLWDIPSESSVHIFEEHEDYVRAGVVSDDNPNLILTGSYDQTVKLFDTRTNSSVMTMQHGAPVESILMYPGGGSAVVSAGGPTIKVWDLLAGGRCIHAISNHQKTITSLAFNSSGSRLLTGSLDHHVKIHNVQDYKVVHSIKYPAPVMSVALSPDDSHLVAGMANGLLSVRQRQYKSDEKATQKKDRDYIRSGTYQYFMRGQSSMADAADFTVERRRRAKLSKYDKFLKQHEYHNALDAVLEPTQRQAGLVTAMLQELMHRQVLESTLSGRDDVSLEPLVTFLIRHINTPSYTNLLVDVSEVLLDIYGPVLGQSPLIDDLLRKLSRKVNGEIDLQKDLIQAMAALDMLFAKSTTSSSSSSSSTAAMTTSSTNPALSTIEKVKA